MTMDNLLAKIQRKNVSDLNEHLELSIADFAQYTGISSASLRNTFFGSNIRTDPSKKTMDRIYEAFPTLPEGVLDRENGFDKEVTSLHMDDRLKDVPPPKAKPRAKPAVVPAVITQVEIDIKIGKTTIHTEVPENIAKEILALVVLGEHSL